MRLGIPARRLAVLLLPLMLAACQTDDGGSPSTFLASDDTANQPFPNNYKAEILAFMRTYLNNPAGLREGAMADPVLRTVSGRPRYISCVRYSERQSDGTYREVRERAIMFINGRLDRVLPNGGEQCVGAAYAPYPDLEKMQR
jgi:hypothetical protein